MVGEQRWKEDGQEIKRVTFNLTPRKAPQNDRQMYRDRQTQKATTAEILIHRHMCSTYRLSNGEKDNPAERQVDRHRNRHNTEISTYNKLFL